MTFFLLNIALVLLIFHLAIWIPKSLERSNIVDILFASISFRRRVKRVAQQRGKIEAIKYVRATRSGLTLAEAKGYVDSLVGE